MNLEILSMRHNIFLIPDFLTPKECAGLIAASERRGYAEVPDTAMDGSVMRKDPRDYRQVVVEDAKQAKRLFQRARTHLPENLAYWQLQGLNARLRYYRYDTGQTFRPHRDRPLEQGENISSTFTFLIYLNDDFTGGETVFYNDDLRPIRIVPPKLGTALVYVHGWIHEGRPVESGRKYVLSTDVIYQREPPPPSPLDVSQAEFQRMLEKVKAAAKAKGIEMPPPKVREIETPPLLTATKFLRELRTGSSMPLVVEGNDGETYVVKPRGSGDGLLASLVEWVALQLGNRLNLPLVEPVAILLPTGFEALAKDPEVSELIARSHCLNFATRWVTGAKDGDAGMLIALDPALRDELFLFDLFLLNVDRSAQNPNLVRGERRVRLLDFASSMALRLSLQQMPVIAEPFLAQIRRNPLYRAEIDPTPFIARLHAAAALSGAYLTDGIPAEWWNGISQEIGMSVGPESLVRQMEMLLDEADVLHTRLNALANIALESDAERRQRIRNNRDDFARRFGRI